MPCIDSHDPLSSALEQTVGKPTRRSANIETNFSADIHFEMAECCRKVKPPSTDKRHRRFDSQWDVGRDEQPGFFQALLIAEHLACKNKRLGFCAGFHQTS